MLLSNDADHLSDPLSTDSLSPNHPPTLTILANLLSPTYTCCSAAPAKVASASTQLTIDLDHSHFSLFLSCLHSYRLLRSSAVPARAVVSSRSVSSSWTRPADPSSETSRAPLSRTTFSPSSSPSVRPDDSDKLPSLPHTSPNDHEVGTPPLAVLGVVKKQVFGL